MVAPYTGAWIEITNHIYNISIYLSHPTRVRGLKLVSDKSIILKDKLTHMESIRNPRTLSYNYFYHHHYMTSLSLFENIHMFYIED